MLIQKKGRDINGKENLGTEFFIMFFKVKIERERTHSINHQNKNIKLNSHITVQQNQS